jgi:hypothetical protein
MSRDIDLLLFTSDAELAARAVEAGVGGIVIDWEQRGKEERQNGADTEINRDTVEDLLRMRRATTGTVVCRINPVSDDTDRELEAAIAAGADEVLVPMVRVADEVRFVLERARSRIRVGILVETTDAVTNVRELDRLPLARVYVGLNDLAIDRGSPTIFSALSDGTVDRVRASVSAPFGVAGMTLPEAGHPIPCRLIVGELARLRCAFTFLRRSFRRDLVGRNLAVELPRMRDAVRTAFARSPEAVERDRSELERCIAELESSEVPLQVSAHG